MAVVLVIGIYSPREAYAAAKIPVKKCTVTLARTKYAYTGKSVKPKVTVKYNGKKQKKNKAYTLAYKNNKKAGTARVKIKGKGKFKGTLTKKFTITDYKLSESNIEAFSFGQYKNQIAINGLTNENVEFQISNTKTASAEQTGSGKNRSWIILTFDPGSARISSERAETSMLRY